MTTHIKIINDGPGDIFMRRIPTNGILRPETVRIAPGTTGELYIGSGPGEGIEIREGVKKEK